MNTEQKINAIMRYIVAESREEKNEALYEIKKAAGDGQTGEKELDAESAIEALMIEIGAPCHILGFNYLVYAINLCVNNEEYLNCIVNGLYADVAEKFNTTASRVERAIRHAIECAWDRCDVSVIEKYFGNTVSIRKGKPTNSEFIAISVKIVKRGMQNG